MKFLLLLPRDKKWNLSLEPTVQWMHILIVYVMPLILFRLRRRVIFLEFNLLH